MTVSYRLQEPLSRLFSTDKNVSAESANYPLRIRLGKKKRGLQSYVEEILRKSSGLPGSARKERELLREREKGKREKAEATRGRRRNEKERRISLAMAIAT